LYFFFVELEQRTYAGNSLVKNIGISTSTIMNKKAYFRNDKTYQQLNQFPDEAQMNPEKSLSVAVFS